MITLNFENSSIRPYPVMILLSCIIGFTILYKLNTHRGISLNIALLTCLFCCSFCPAGRLLLTWLTSGGTAFGLSSIGGLAGMYTGCLTAALLSRKRGYPIVILQNCTLILPLMYSISKIGCLLAGCCYGFPCSHFGIRYSHVKTPVFPVQLLESLLFAGIFIAGQILLKQHHKYTIHIIFLLSAFTKFLLDFLRASHAGIILSVTQLLCLLLILTDSLLLYSKTKNITEERNLYL